MLRGARLAADGPRSALPSKPLYIKIRLVVQSGLHFSQARSFRSLPECEERTARDGLAKWKVNTRGPLRCARCLPRSTASRLLRWGRRGAHRLQEKNVSVGNPFFERPILNSPYEYPIRHWELDDQGQPTQRTLESRRRAEFI